VAAEECHPCLLCHVDLVMISSGTIARWLCRAFAVDCG
jgi:hypothetical protein